MNNNQNHLMEVQMDTLVGMTHHFGGHAKGNHASLKHRGELSNPKQAALQGLKKMEKVLELGIPQLVLPPQTRPHWKSLTNLGFKGKLQEQLEDIYKTAPDKLAKISSSAFIWTANAATIFPSCDTNNGKVHFHIANLNSHFHREIEAEDRYHLFKTIFSDPHYFEHHPPLSSSEFRDEGAANHTRLEGGYHLFVYGDPTGTTPGFEGIPRRQCLESQKLMSLQSGLDEHHVLYLQQSDQALKAGVFHNDVAAVGMKNYYLCHENAYRGGLSDLEKITTWYNINSDKNIELIVVSQQDLSLEEAVESYLFNTQWLESSDGSVHILAPEQCKKIEKTKKIIDQWLNEHSNWNIHYFDIEQSMNNGGGPACLRCRVPLTPVEYDKVHDGIKLTFSKLSKLEQWVHKHYPEQFELSDLLNPEFRNRQENALEKLYQLLDLPLHLLSPSHE